VNYAALHYVMEECPLKGAKWRVLLVLAYHADKTTGHAHPGTRTIAREGRLSSSLVDGFLRELLEEGHIALILTGAGRRAATYQIVGHLDNAAPGEAQPVEPTEDEPRPSAAPGEAQPGVDDAVDDRVAPHLRPRSASPEQPVAPHLSRASIGGREELEGLKGPAPAVVDPPAAAVGDGSGNGDAHQRAGRALRSLIEGLKADREARSRALAREQLGRAPPPRFVTTVRRTVGVDVVLRKTTILHVGLDAVIVDPAKEGAAA
jgi:hypothetical protein